MEFIDGQDTDEERRMDVFASRLISRFGRRDKIYRANGWWVDRNITSCLADQNKNLH